MEEGHLMVAGEQPMFMGQQTGVAGGDPSIKQSSVHDNISVRSINESMPPEALVKFFEQYQPESDLPIGELHKSQQLKLKRYKECAYYGEMLNNKRHGKGVMVYHNNRLYEGEWESDYKHGKGYEKFTNGSKYDGQYVNGKPEGVGTYLWPNGELYEGEWINGLKHGSGMWRGARGDSYIGQWKFGKADGYGVHTWVNGDRYEGEFKSCLKHGEGTEKFANGDIYIGSYVNGKPSGYGQYYWANGSFFKGNFKNGLRHGNGVWKRGPGESDKYEGEYANDKKSGYGIFTWASGNTYKGNYFDDVRHGYGEMYWNDGSCYKGNWEKGIQHGEGQIIMPGQSPKRGIFEENVLISLVDGSGNSAGLSNQRPQAHPHPNQYRPMQRIEETRNEQSRQGYIMKGNNRTSKEPDGLSNHSRGYPTTTGPNRLNINSSHRESSVSQKSGQSIRVNRLSMRPTYANPIMRDSFAKTSTNRGSKDQIRQKIPHSSFYLHQLNNQRPLSRDTHKVNSSVLNESMGDPGTRSTGGNHRVRRIQTGAPRKDMIQEMREFTQARINSGGPTSKPRTFKRHEM